MVYAATIIIPSATAEVHHTLTDLHHYPVWNDVVSAVYAPPGPCTPGIHYGAMVRCVIGARITLTESTPRRVAYRVKFEANAEHGHWELSEQGGNYTMVRHIVELSGQALTSSPVNFSDVALWRLQQLAQLLIVQNQHVPEIEPRSRGRAEQPLRRAGYARSTRDTRESPFQ